MIIKIPDHVVEKAKIAAQNRHVAHQRQSTHRPIRPNHTDAEPEWYYQYLGIINEYAGCKAFGLPMDWELRPAGDNRKDGMLPNGWTIDFKGLRPYHSYLLREVGKRHAEVLVAVKYFPERREAQIVGWEFDEELLKCPAKPPRAKIGPHCHELHISRLKNPQLLLEVAGVA